MTMYTTLSGRTVPIETRRERLALPDGDFVDLDWVDVPNPQLTLVLFHGLEGSIDSPYARGLLVEGARRGWQGVLMHFRGCSGEPNRLPRAYHSGETGDARTVLAEVQARAGDRPMAAVGYSLGGNVLLKYLGEEGAKAPLVAAAAACVPMMLSPCAAKLRRGFSRVYDRWLLRLLKASLRRKRAAVDLGDVGRIDERELGSIWAFDERITAPLHGFAGAEDYYARSSSRPYLNRIRVPTLILHALDDPFMTAEVVPNESELSDAVTLELSDRGGHVAYIAGSPWRPRYWLEERIPEFLAETVAVAVEERAAAREAPPAAAMVA